MRVVGDGLRVILGTMTFGGQTNQDGAAAQLSKLLANGHVEIDTARMYEHGKTEEMLGRILKDREDLRAVKVATKANAFGGYDKVLTEASVRKQMAASREALGAATPVDIYYLHNPDPTTPILETLKAMDELHKAGKFAELGLSNYAAWEVANIYRLCKENGYVLPTVYQGMYNCITRDVERELLPCLRALSMRFNAYNPLAGGLLACKHTRESLKTLDDGSRFRKSNKMYRDRYLQEQQLVSVDAFAAACKATKISPVDAALRWMVKHSQLRSGDGLILGASKLEHLVANLDAVEGATMLPQEVVAACDEGWARVKSAGICPSYERGTSLYE